MAVPDENALRQAWQEAIARANEGRSLDEARRRLIQLLEADAWLISQRAETDGRRILREQPALGKRPTQWGICELILECLRAGFPLRAIGMGEPQGSNGIGYIMRNVDGAGLYIKVMIDEDRVRVLSFHN
ncbi:MAG: hypothetical protein K2R98_33970 [Gemmataceae bacterium]|nr:hypothetical protein [Gemmataceae bacterium]